MNIVEMRRIDANGWGPTYKGFIFMNKDGKWVFQHYGENGWAIASLAEFCPA